MQVISPLMPWRQEPLLVSFVRDFSFRVTLPVVRWCADTNTIVGSWTGWAKCVSHDDVIKWKHFPRNWPFVREIHRSPVNFPHKGQWRGALMFSLIYAWINDWVNNREAGDLRRQHGHYDVIVMWSSHASVSNFFAEAGNARWCQGVPL